MRQSSVMMMLAVAIVAMPLRSSFAATVPGGGSAATDCALVLEVAGANKPAAPHIPKAVDCVDGDTTCDSDGLRNGECVFPVQLCVNSTSSTSCNPDSVDNITIDHAIDNGDDPRFDTNFQALQTRANALFPSSQNDFCSLASSITVGLVGPDSSNVMKKNRKSLRITTYGATTDGDVRDVDKVKFTCRPEGDGVYLPTDLYQGTFDRIRKQIFAQTCALSSCHDSESHQGNLILLSGAAYGNLVGVTPDNAPAAADSILRVTAGDETKSFLYLKLTANLQPGYGASMPYLQGPIDSSLIELIRLWIIGDNVTGPAPQNGWVVGTDN